MYEVSLELSAINSISALRIFSDKREMREGAEDCRKAAEWASENERDDAGLGGMGAEEGG